MRAGRATFLIKVKLHGGEPINERADTLAEKGREISEDNKRWDDRTDRMTFDESVEDTKLSTNKQHTLSGAERGHDSTLSVDEQCPQCLPKASGAG